MKELSFIRKHKLILGLFLCAGILSAGPVYSFLIKAEEVMLKDVGGYFVPNQAGIKTVESALQVLGAGGGGIGLESDPIFVNWLDSDPLDGFVTGTPWTSEGYLTSEADPIVRAITGIVKSNGTTISAAVAGTDYQTPLTADTHYLTPTTAASTYQPLGSYLTAETDPKISTLTNGKWCTTNGSVITCTVDPVVDTNTTYTASGTLLQLSSTAFSLKEGTLTNGKFCTYSTTSGLVCTSDANNYSLPTATDSVLGGVKVGSGLSITEGVLSATGGGYTNLTSFEDQTAWRLFYSDADGDVTELALGSDGEYLKSNGASVAPSWGTPIGGAHDAVTLAGQDYLSLSTQQITANLIKGSNINWDTIENISDVNINWTDFDVPSDAINWDAFPNNQGYLTAVNWDEIPVIQSAGINWDDVEEVAPLTEAMIGDLGTYLTSVNWDAAITGINWAVLDEDDLSGVNWDAYVGGGSETSHDNIIYVGKHGNDANSGLTVGLAKLTIASAITASASGDTILVYAGTYNESGLKLKAGTSLIGADFNLVIITDTPSEGSSSDGSGIVEPQGDAYIANISVIDTTDVDTTAYTNAIDLSEASGGTIEIYNVYAEGGYDGIFLGAGVNTVHTTIRNSYITSDYDGIAYYGDTGSTLRVYNTDVNITGSRSIAGSAERCVVVLTYENSGTLTDVTLDNVRCVLTTDNNGGDVGGFWSGTQTAGVHAAVWTITNSSIDITGISGANTYGIFSQASSANSVMDIYNTSINVSGGTANYHIGEYGGAITTQNVSCGDTDCNFYGTVDSKGVLVAGSDGDSSTTSSNSGLEFIEGNLTLIRGCSADEILKWNETTDTWACGEGGGGSISGTDTHVMFFDGANTPAGDAGFVYNKTTDSATLSGSLTTGGAVGGVTLVGATSDPCGTFDEGTIFYNTTSNYMCYCNGTDDVKMSDDTTACF